MGVGRPAERLGWTLNAVGATFVAVGSVMVWIFAPEFAAGTALVVGHPTQSELAELSVLHKTGHLARLQETRAGAKVYVIPACVYGRPTEEHGRPNKAAAALQERIDLIRATAQRWADDPCQNPLLTEPERYSYACRHCAAQTILHMIGDK